MKKIDIAANFVAQNLALFICPVCQAPMQSVDEHSVICENGHSLDFNKHGYLYFLTHGVKSEYGDGMLSARRQILAAGLFDPIINHVNQQLSDQPQKILDVGCGEGTPLSKLEHLRDNRDTAIGFDISKDGINLATQLPTDAFFCLADLRNLPFADHSFETIIELFSPSDYQEFKRLLAPDGTLYKVIPNAGYLQEIRKLLYPDGELSTYDNQNVLTLFKEHFEHVTVKQLQYQFEVPENLRAKIIEMTPLHWGKNALSPSAEQIRNLTKVTVDVSVLQAQNDKI